MFKKVLFLLLVYWMSRYLLVLVDSIVLFLKTYKLIDFAKIVFLLEQTNICEFKDELRGFYDFTLRNIDINQYHIQKKNEKNAFFKNEAFLYIKNCS